MEYHPYSEIWPLIEGAEFEKLKADIEANGLLLPIITYKNKILDGRNRDRACRAAGVRVRYEEAKARTDDEALKLVWSLNDHRRHLSVAQRAFAAAKIANVIHGSNQHRDKVERPTGPSTSEKTSLKQASELSGVSPGSIKRAKVILAAGTPRDVADVVAGRASLQAKCIEVRPVRSPRVPKPVKRSSIPGGDRVLKFVNTPPMKSMTRDQVDPEFTGTMTEWKDKYGHVQVMTAEQYATMRFGDWASAVRAANKKCSELLPERPVDHNWLRSPKPYDIAKMTEALDSLRPKVAEAEALLARAVSATKQKAS